MHQYKNCDYNKEVKFSFQKVKINFEKCKGLHQEKIKSQLHELT